MRLGDVSRLASACDQRKPFFDFAASSHSTRCVDSSRLSAQRPSTLEDTSAPSCVSTSGSGYPRSGSWDPTARPSASFPPTRPSSSPRRPTSTWSRSRRLARPPVCKLMDYGKFKYENAQKAREARRNQTNVIIKEMKLRPKIDQHDYETKKGHVVRFLRAGDKVKITIMFRGREQHRPELGFRLLQRLAEDVEELGFVESSPKQDGRNMIMVLGPHRKKAEAKVEREGREGDPRRRAGRRGGRGARRAHRRQRRTRRLEEEGARPLREPRPRDRGLRPSGGRGASRSEPRDRRDARAATKERTRCRRTRRTPVRASASA